MAEEFTSLEQTLIARLGRAPQPTLGTERFEAIRLQMLNAMDAPPIPAPRPRGRLPLSTPVLAVSGIIAVVVVAVLAASGAFTPPAPTAQPTFKVVPSSTSTLTITPSPTPSLTLTATVTLTPTLETTPEVTPDITEIDIVIDGTVTGINGNVVVVYNIPIELDPDNPILETIKIGDKVHVEGHNDGTTVIGTTITYTNPTPVPNDNDQVTTNPSGGEVNANPSTGETWTDDGKCDHPPPDWAPANGWRRRCQAGSSSPPNGNGNGDGMGMGNGGDNGNGNGNGMGMGG